MNDVSPATSAAGENVIVPSGFAMAIPRAPAPSTECTDRPSFSASKSLSSTRITTGRSSNVAATSGSTVGGSFTGKTVTATVAVSVPPLPSDNMYENEVVPAKSRSGKKRTEPEAWASAVPLVPLVLTALTASSSPSASASFASTSMVFPDESSYTVAESGEAAGGEFGTGSERASSGDTPMGMCVECSRTFTATVPGGETAPCPSATLYVNVVKPENPASATNSKPPPSCVTDAAPKAPVASTDNMVTASPSGSESLNSTSMDTGSVPNVCARSSRAKGARLVARAGASATLTAT